MLFRSPSYAQDSVAAQDIDVFIFEEYARIYTSESWDMELADNSTIWVQEDKLVYEVLDEGIFVRGARVPFEGATAFRGAFGYDRCLVFKATTANIRSARVIVESDWRGTNVQVNVHRTDGSRPGQFILGGISEVQTVTFRGNSSAASIFADNTNASFQLQFGVETFELEYGADASVWKAALESLPNIDKVTVKRSGDGATAPYSYGFVYTVAFWGEYGTTDGIPQLMVVNTSTFLSGVEVVQDTVREAEVFAGYSNRYIALEDSRKYTAQVRAMNSEFLSSVSELQSQTTEHIGGLPGAPQSVVLGQYRTANTLSLSYEIPQHDGGLPITTYIVEQDSSTSFDPHGNNYKATNYNVIPEVQEIVVSYRAGDNVKVRGGTFTLTFGGRTTADLAVDITAYDLEIALNLLIGTRHVSVSPVTVTRMTYNRGYKWTVLFNGIHGDVGLLLVDTSLLEGDDPRMSVREVTKGHGDVVPGSYTYEVQTVRTTALSIIAGTFKLNMEGYDTEPIYWNETAEEFKQKLESLHTIYTVNVERETLNTDLQLFAWQITFTHMKNERVQGSSNIPPLTVSYSTLTPAMSAEALVFEEIKGSSPMRIDLTDLKPGLEYAARVTAYNNRGFSLKSAVSNAITLGQSPAPTSVTLGVASATSLDVTWSDPSSTLYQVDGYLVESYTSLPVYEVQVITSSSSSSLDEIQRLTVESDDDNLAGFFKLEFDGETTDNIAWNANAVGDDSVAIALARLSTVGEVEVSRMESRRVVQGLRVSTSSSSQILTVVEGTTVDIAYGDKIWISNKEFTVAAVTSSTIDIGANFDEEDIVNVKVFKWTYGYTWDITFTTQIGDQSQIIPSSAENWAGTNPIVKVVTVREGVAPLSGTFRVGFMGDMTGQLPYDISAVGMEVAIESLATIGDVSVERFRNGFGYDWRVTFLTELFDLPDMYIIDAALAGPFAKCDVSTASDGVVPDGYVSTVVSGGNLRSTTLSGLVMGTKYQIRVRAHNDEGYSYATLSSPSFLAPKEAPSSPFNATIFPLSEARLKVVWMAPQSDGGATITRYRVEWDISDSFSNVGISTNRAEFAVMAGDGPFFC